MLILIIYGYLDSAVSREVIVFYSVHYAHFKSVIKPVERCSKKHERLR